MKIRSLLLGSAALCGLASAGYAADLGLVTALDITSDIGNDFDGFLLGTTACSAVAMMPDGHFGHDPGGHLSAKTEELGDALLIGSIMGDPGDLGLAYPDGNGFIGAPAAGHGPS